MKCPYCGAEGIQSHRLPPYRRQRAHPPPPGVPELPYAVHDLRGRGNGAAHRHQKDNSREPFDRQKLLNAMLRACAKRPVSYESLERAVSSIEQTLMSTYDREVTSVRIGELTMQELKKIDEVAYVRFASVYQQFADVESFFNELKKLMGDRKK